ncbi:hypothetical protein [Phytoactinopolyspora mesophila]|uniref:Uncharacterized protein n=1 Tax=Phytoactinopolyspora mesophila TaxID=2650750 RepID=A0A7K3M593_9ACTN|nr:hypothetical protein [Phytoactinopolyspora mesophila]NDL58390.1 hypothetical protein [Phytoactinopolyspora mesophila]
MNAHERDHRENEPPPGEDRVGSPGSPAEEDLAGEDDLLDDDDLGDEGDFAEEHSRPTFADDQDGGPEGIREPESPRGTGGDGGMD